MGEPKRIWVFISVVASTCIIVPGAVFLPSALGKSIALLVGLIVGFVIQLIAGRATLR